MARAFRPAVTLLLVGIPSGRGQEMLVASDPGGACDASEGAGCHSAPGASEPAEQPDHSDVANWLQLKHSQPAEQREFCPARPNNNSAEARQWQDRTPCDWWCCDGWSFPQPCKVKMFRHAHCWRDLSIQWYLSNEMWTALSTRKPGGEEFKFFGNAGRGSGGRSPLRASDHPDDNWKSAFVTGECKSVEFYDEDEDRRGYYQNVKQAFDTIKDKDKVLLTGYCVDLPYDLSNDVSGVYIIPEVENIWFHRNGWHYSHVDDGWYSPGTEPTTPPPTAAPPMRRRRPWKPWR